MLRRTDGYNVCLSLICLPFTAHSACFTLPYTYLHTHVTYCHYPSTHGCFDPRFLNFLHRTTWTSTYASLTMLADYRLLPLITNLVQLSDSVERKGSDVIPIPGGVVQEACGGDGLSQMVCKHENDDPNKPGKWDFNPNKPKCRERWEKCSTKSEKLQKVGSKKLVKRSTQPSSSSLSDGETMNLDERAVPPPVTQIAIFRWESTHCVPADPNIPCPWSNGYSDPNIGTRGA